MGVTIFIGMIVCFAAMLYGIVDVGGLLMDFYDPPSIFMTVVPTIAAIVSTYPLTMLAKIPSHIKAMIRKEYRPDDYILKIIELAKVSRSEGILALENEETKDEFMQYALGMVVDGLDEMLVRDSLDENLDALSERHMEAIGIYEKAAAYGPAFGMVGTVISLINMLMGLDFSDSEAINKLGINMAAALITTLYGSILANVIFIPMAGRLKTLHKKEVFCKKMIGNGILSIQRGDNPAIIYNSLLEQVDKKTKKRLEAKASGEAGAGRGGGGGGEEK